MKKGRLKLSNKKLWILFGVLCVVIAGLWVGIAVVNNMAETDTRSDEDIVNDVLDTIEPMNIDEAVIYLDELLVIYNGSDLEVPIKMIKFNAIANANQFEEVIAYSESIDANGLDDTDKLNFYSVLRYAYSEIGDEESANFYDEKFIDLYYEIFGEGEGV